MLILTRKVGERIYLLDRIVIEVVSLDRGRVRLGITAPQDVVALREELVAFEDRERIESAARGVHG
jgi:carbon storage regulator